MDFELVWTKRAITGYDRIINYLLDNWSEREVRNFIKESEEFFSLLVKFPNMLTKSATLNNVYRGPMNKLTLITYKVKTRKKEIQIINIRSTRQQPIK
jgi:plasmid stabilization system protein ParE